MRTRENFKWRPESEPRVGLTLVIVCLITLACLIFGLLRPQAQTRRAQGVPFP